MDVHPASLGPAVVAESAAPDAGRLVVHAKCRAEDRDFPLALGRDFPKAEAVRLAAAVRRGAWVLLDEQGQLLPVRRLPVVLLEVVCSRELRAEPVLLQAVKQELQGEWVSAQQVRRASQQMEHPQAPALAP